MDDIETALNSDYKINLQLTTKNELKNNDIYFKRYLKEKIHFKVDNIPKEFKYIGKEYDGDLVYFYLEIENINQLKTIDLTNNILTKHFPEQQNLVQSRKRGDKTYKSLLLTKKEQCRHFKILNMNSHSTQQQPSIYEKNRNFPCSLPCICCSLLLLLKRRKPNKGHTNQNKFKQLKACSTNAYKCRKDGLWSAR